MDRHRKARPERRPGAAARQLGLLVDFTADGTMMEVNDDENDADLEAELAAITGETPASKAGRPKGKTPLPMQDIERMAALCMKDLDEDEQDEDVDDDEDLLAELSEVLQDTKEEQTKAPTPPSHRTRVPDITPQQQPSTAPAGVESVLTERIDAYKSAINNAKQSGESSKVRRYERGLKTLQTMLTSAKKGKKINEEEIPPPVATGKSSNAVSLSTAPATESPSPLQVSDSPDSAPGGPAAPAPRRGPPLLLPKPTLTVPPPATAPRPPERTPVTAPHRESGPAVNNRPGRECSEQEAVQSRQREYKLAALHAKRRGDTQLAAQYYQISKKFDPALEALASGAAVDLSKLPPPPDSPNDSSSTSPGQSSPPVPASNPPQPLSAPGVPPPPRDVMEALQQRMDKYKSAAAQAKGEGNDRKARMHERIVKQYQDAIRGHKAGRSVNLAELPVPPGFPSIQGLESSGPSLAGMLDNAMQLVNQEVSDAEAEAKPVVRTPAPKSQQQVPAGAPSKPTAKQLSNKAQQQLQFLENRKKQLMKAALRTKQKNDLEGAKLYLRQAKGLDPMIEAAKGGLPVDIKKVPPPPESEEDFVLVQGRGVHIPHKTAEQYAQLVEVLKQQHETCMKYSKQYTHLGNVSETTKFERMAEECKKNIEILKRAHAQGYPLPKYHHEERTFQVVKIFPNLTSSDMILFIVKGINLPAPSGVSPNDLDTFVKFEFAFPNTEEAQKDKTSVMKNTNCPEYNEQFKLTINRGHRGFKRVVHSKGIKFEVVHKGGLFKTDRPVGNAQLKLEKLESQCELREIIEVLDGKKTTGGRMEVMVRIREPLSSQQLERTTEKWLVIDPHSIPAIAVPKAKQRQEPPREVGRSRPGPAPSPAPTFHSFNVLKFDKERLERKIQVCKQEQKPVPRELLDQHRELQQRLQWQKSQLERGDPVLLRAYRARLQDFLQYYTQAATRLGTEGSRELAKEALYKRKLVEDELQRLRC
eukprot:gi/632977324/ref/XP_007905283.1/ PREDICTED: coiled-coil and C2 domain-containing protein 1A [Callorhinchus milii]